MHPDLGHDTHYVQACEGFSSDVDVMLRNAAIFDSFPEWERYVAILIDQMYVQEDLAFDRCNGNWWALQTWGRPITI